MNILKILGISTIVSVTLALGSCNGDNGVIDDKENAELSDIPKEKFKEKSHIIGFFKGQLDAINVSYPDKDFYREVISTQDMQQTKADLWKYWQQANGIYSQETLEGWNFSDIKGNNYQPKHMVWNIPENEVMPITTFAKGEKPADGYPMFINLHGGGSYPNEKGAHTSQINEDEYKAIIKFSAEYKDAPSFYFMPRMSDDRKGRWSYMPQRYVYKRAYQKAVLSGMIDPDRFYLTGISEGGYGTLRVSMFMPDYFAAVGVIAAADDPNIMALNFRNLPFRMDVGENDSGYRRNLYAYRWEDKMEELKSKYPNDFVHIVNIQEGRDHLGTRYLDTTPWMISYKRNSYPSNLTYVYYNIHPEGATWQGGFNEGVYYLDLRKLKASSNNSRLRIDVSKTGNSYAVNTENVSENSNDNVSGELAIYLSEVDFSKNIVITHNGKEIYNDKPKLNRGVAIESISLFGDPKRVYFSKIIVKL